MPRDVEDIEFARANRAITKTAARIAAEIHKLLDKPFEVVSRDYRLEQLLLAVANDLAAIIDDNPMFYAGPATLKLSNALLDYRDSRFEHR